MCGICGFLGPATGEDDAAVIRAMAGAIAHRGPDGQQESPIRGADGAAGWLGHRRLRILDLTDAARQPMASREGGPVLVFNGEVYNFMDLRHELRILGHSFRSTGDTEVVLRAYEEWGEAFVERIDGMFALAVWDSAANSLLLARDRTGKKPLFYACQEGRLTFASEIKALARAPWLQLDPELERMGAFLTFGYVPAPSTFYRGISQVPPATLMRWDSRGHRLSERRFWSPLPAGRTTSGGTALECVRGGLEHAVSRRMVADVPLGALLSGGVDSSAVTALMVRQADRPVSTFSVGFADNKTFDERPVARRVANRLGTDHTELEVRPDAVALLDRLVWLHDGPFGDSSALPTYLLCAAARTKVTVALTGDGGDEVFGGYQRFTAAALSQGAPAWFSHAAAPLLRFLPGNGDFYGPRRRATRFVETLGLPLEERYLAWTSIFTPDGIVRLIGRSAARDAAQAMIRRYEEARSLPPIDRLLHVNFCTYLPDDLAVKIDRTSMAHGLEARAPFLDTALIELLGRVRARDKVGLRHPKPLLRRALEPLLPREIWRRPKHGFGVPVDGWFRGELGDLFADEVLGDGGRLRDVMDDGELRSLWAEHRTGRAQHGARLWTLMTLERWLRDLGRAVPLAEPASRPGVEVQG